jgi:hypothetical protein
LALQEMEDLTDRIGTVRRDGVDVARLRAQPTGDLVEVDQPRHRDVDLLRGRELVQRRRGSPAEGHHQGDRPVLRCQHVEAAFAVRARRVDEDQRPRHDPVFVQRGFIHAGRVRVVGFVILAAV